MSVGGTKIVAMDFCYHGNHCVGMATKKCLETHRIPLCGSVATPLIRPLERVKALVVIYKGACIIYMTRGPGET